MLLLNSISPHLPISFGGAAISGEGGGYGFGVMSENNAIELLHYSFDQGIRIFDTAPIYGFGLSEKRIGLAFAKNRDQVFIVSKCGVDWHDNQRVNMTNDPKVAEKMLERSRQDLQSDYIDLYMIHWPDAKVDIRRTLEVLAKAQEQHKIKYIGLCNTTIEDLEKAKEVARIEVVQAEFNYFEKKNEELFPYLKEHNISFMSWGTFDKGILTGRVTAERKFDQEDCRSWAPWWKSSPKNKKFEEVERIKSSLKEGESLVHFALKHNLSYPEVTSLICGFRSADQLRDIVSYFSLKNKY